jgi:hypothetical protein
MNIKKVRKIKEKRFIAKYVNCSKTRNGLATLRNDETDLIKQSDRFSKWLDHFGY